MTVRNRNSKDVYRGNGVTTVFPFTFDCPKAAYLHVYVGDGTAKSEETDNFVLDLVNKRITYPAEGEPLPSSKLLTISRKLPLQQLMDLVEHGPFLAEDLEKAYDELTMMIQQCAEALDRTLKLDLSMEMLNLVVPWAPGKGFRVSDDGTKLEMTEDPAKVLPLVNAALAAAREARDALLLRPGYLAVEGDLENIDKVAGVSEHIPAVAEAAEHLDEIETAPGYAAAAKRYAVGEPSEPEEGSAKHWAEQAARITQADWEEEDVLSGGFIRNKPDFDSKQDKLTAAQMAAVNSGMTETKVATYDGYATSIPTAVKSAGDFNAWEKFYNAGANGNISLSNGPVQACSASSITLPTVQNGYTLMISCTYSGDVTWNGNIKWAGGTAPDFDLGDNVCVFTGVGEYWLGNYNGGYR